MKKIVLSIIFLSTTSCVQSTYTMMTKLTSSGAHNLTNLRTIITRISLPKQKIGIEPSDLNPIKKTSLLRHSLNFAAGAGFDAAAGATIGTGGFLGGAAVSLITTLALANFLDLSKYTDARKPVDTMTLTGGMLSGSAAALYGGCLRGVRSRRPLPAIAGGFLGFVAYTQLLDRVTTQQNKRED